jgi:hypothetical protein
LEAALQQVTYAATESSSLFTHWAMEMGFTVGDVG